MSGAQTRESAALRSKMGYAIGRPTSGTKLIPLALAHDYLVQMGGAEQVVGALHRAFPRAPIYTSLVGRAGLLEDLKGATLKISFLRLFAVPEKYFKLLLPFFPIAFLSFKPVSARVVLISSSAFAHWIRRTRATKKICYCHTPPRFLWEASSYLDRELSSRAARVLVRPLLWVMKNLDRVAARSIDEFIANSKYTQARILELYGRDSRVVYPPVRLEEFEPSKQDLGYYLIVSRLIGYKRVDIAVKAFLENGRRLVVIGSGPDLLNLEKLADRAMNIEFRGRVSRRDVIDAMRDCSALIFPGVEDFGITPLEANACGKPVIAFAGGGALETISEGVNGTFFHSQTSRSLNDAVTEFEKKTWRLEDCVENARRFSEPHFIAAITGIVTLESTG